MWPSFYYLLNFISSRREGEKNTSNTSLYMEERLSRMKGNETQRHREKRDNIHTYMNDIEGKKRGTDGIKLMMVCLLLKANLYQYIHEKKVKFNYFTFSLHPLKKRISDKKKKNRYSS